MLKHLRTVLDTGHLILRYRNQLYELSVYSHGTSLILI